MATINIKDEDLKEVRRVLDTYFWTMWNQMYDKAPDAAAAEFMKKNEWLYEVLDLLEIELDSHDILGYPWYQDVIDKKEAKETESWKYKLAYHLIIMNKDEKAEDDELSIQDIVDNLGIEVPKYDNSKPNESYDKYIGLMQGAWLGNEVYKALEKKGLITQENKDRVDLTLMVWIYTPYTHMYNECGFNTLQLDK